MPAALPPPSAPAPIIPRSTNACGTDPVEIGGWVEVAAASLAMGKVTDRARLARSLKRPDDVTTSLVFLDPVPTTVERFWIGRAEVTEGEYARCVAAGACTPPATADRCGGAADLPVNCVSFQQASRYCEATGARLPTEAEWELAARGAEGRLFAWGDTADEAAFSGVDRLPVGTCRVRDTPQGIHDMAGNGREWTSSGEGGTRIAKGMACYYELSCLAFNRFGQTVDERHDYLGFRCARSDGPGPAVSRFAAALAPAGTSAAPPSVHWSTLIDTFPAARGPVSRETICFVDVGFDASGRAKRVHAIDRDRPEEPACPEALRPLAESAARAVIVAPREGGAFTTLPVRITP